MEVRWDLGFVEIGDWAANNLIQFEIREKQRPFSAFQRLASIAEFTQDRSYKSPRR